MHRRQQGKDRVEEPGDDDTFEKTWSTAKGNTCIFKLLDPWAYRIHDVLQYVVYAVAERFLEYVFLFESFLTFCNMSTSYIQSGETLAPSTQTTPVVLGSPTSGKRGTSLGSRGLLVPVGQSGLTNRD